VTLPGPAGGPGRGPAAGPPGADQPWLVLTASERGASHVAIKSPNQDAVATERAGTCGVVAAVADGHGHSRHLRSARGSRLAVKIGCEVAQELADQIEGNSEYFSQRAPDGTDGGLAGKLARLAEEFLVPAIVGRWRDAALADVEADPFTEAEQDLRHPGDDGVIAYGSTLLLGIALLDWLILAQIGDGDVVAVRSDGQAVQPVPGDPLLDGLVTTSLCGTDPQSDFRIAVVDTAREPLIAVLLATDGYGNAQVIEAWPAAFSKDLAWMLAERDLQWLASQLPAWAARCASADGSADDTTVALLVSAAASVLRAAGAGATGSGNGSEETTIPAARHGDTVPAHISAEHQIEPVTMQQLAHRAAPEPVMLERVATTRASYRPADHGTDTTELVSHEPDTTELVIHEPTTNEIPKLRHEQGGAENDDGWADDDHWAGDDHGSGGR
jgi:hypothetical protein